MFVNLYKKIIITIILFISSTCSLYSQGIQLLRYNDDFSYLKNDSSRKKGFHLKYIKLANNMYLSVGGELRQQAMYYKNISFGEIPSNFKTSTTAQTLHRAMLHINIEYGKHLRFFVQGYNTVRLVNPNPESVVDQNNLAIHQAFVDIHPMKNILLRIGRQEFMFGKEKFMSVREGPNNRQSFDALTFKYNSKNLRTDIYYARQVIPSKGVFDDKRSDEYISGIYIRVTAVPRRMLLDVFYHSFGSDSRMYNYETGSESRNTTGFRIYSENKILNYDLESAIQWGSFMNKRIQAYSVFTDLNYLIQRKILIGLGGNLATGDRDPNDGNINTYNTMFGRPAFGQAAGQGLANTLTYNPYLRLYIGSKVNIQTGMTALRRQSNKDGIYTNSMRLTRPAQDKLLVYDKYKIGQVYTLDFNYVRNNNFSSSIQGATFAANDFIIQSGKSNQVYFFSVKGAYRF